MPSFFAVHSGIPWLVVAVLLLQLGVWYALMTGAESTLFAELFDTAVALMPRWIGGRPFWAAGTRW